MSIMLMGWVEIKRHDHWSGLFELHQILISGGGFAALGILLGIPIGWDTLEDAELRGLPEDRSEEARQLWGDLDDFETTTWVGWDEIETVDWSVRDAAQIDDWLRLVDIIKILKRDESIQDVRLLIEFA